MRKSSLKLDTSAIKSTQKALGNFKAVSQPIVLSTTFERNEDGSYEEGYVYSRADNPNRKLLENCVAELEKGAVAYAFGSGMASIHAVFQSLQTGDHVLIPDDVYYNVYKLVEEVFKRWGLSYTLVDMTDLEQVQQAIRPNTTLIWAETPSNPQLKVSDIPSLAEIAQKNDILLAVDNTWPTPVIQNPLDLGADIVMHSTTKYFGGHSDVLGGCIVLKEDNELSEKIQQIQAYAGGIPSPFDCWLITRGIQTLPLRVKTQCENAASLAQYLNQHPKIVQVNYPGLVSHPQHKIAVKQMQHGFGGMLSVLVKGTEKEVFQVANALKLFTTATSLGGVESLVEHRKSVEGPLSQTPENLLRISVGIEHIEDLILDWEKALTLIE